MPLGVAYPAAYPNQAVRSGAHGRARPSIIEPAASDASQQPQRSAASHRPIPIGRPGPFAEPSRSRGRRLRHCGATPPLTPLRRRPSPPPPRRRAPAAAIYRPARRERPRAPRECGAMRRRSGTDVAGQRKLRGGRTCHRKHVEDG
ncbi:hypothetical protein PVAP13_6NG147003 [Panicum virgatum]|uniref:Uncharacterized protein n=1 Tax=Panicum virgatum TaxID=38727 RepID=A0A8T0R0K8_PANVG|nr:hypothetical protein PVAP13_6NG147003 [Panicum virgatum]